MLAPRTQRRGRSSERRGRSSERRGRSWEWRGRGSERRGRARAAFGLAVAALILATYLQYGYRYGEWPQRGSLDFALRFSGELRNDWHTSLPPPHWAFTHALGLVPPGALPGVVLGGWLAGLTIFWSAFVAICRSFGVPLLGAVAAGLVVLQTRLGAVGRSAPHLFEFLYPNGLSFALAVAALAALLRARLVLAGVALGAATLVHPNLGLIAAAVIGPAALLVGRRRPRRLLLAALAYLVLSGASLARSVADQSAGSPLPADQRFELLAVVRAPHHFLYSAFPPFEYIQTGLWAVALVVGLVLLRRPAVSRIVGLTAVTVVVLCAAGGLASAAGAPLALVQANTARLSPLIVLLGVVAVAGALSRLGEALAPMTLALAFLLAAPLAGVLAGGRAARQASDSGWISESATAAGLLLLAVVGFCGVRRLWRARSGEADRRAGHGEAARDRQEGYPRTQGARADRRSLARSASTAAAVTLLAIAAVVLVAGRLERAGRPEGDAAFQDIALRARAASGPAEVILAPPDLYGFGFLAHRPSVVDFGTFPFGVGDAEWIRRIVDVTGDPSVLDPARRGTSEGARRRLVRAGYERSLGRSPLPLCRYGVRLVVTRRGAPLPPWLTEVDANRRFRLLRVRPGTCQSGVMRQASG